MKEIKLSTSSPNPVLMLINADTTGQITARATELRLPDYAALKAELRADIIDRNTIKAQRWSRLFNRIAGTSITLAVLAWLRRNRYQIFYSDAENNGLALALLFKLTRTRRPLFMIGHWITPTKKATLVKMLRIYTHFTTLFLHSSEQYKKAIEEMGVPVGKVKMLPYQVDTEFWNPKKGRTILSETDEPYICSAGLEFRDYSTLLEAIKDNLVKLKIGAASNWSKRKVNILNESLSSNVEVKSYNYHELRDLYTGSRFVVVPLVDVDFQAGITVILEAMAMGKAVVVTRSQGQGDTVIDRRKAIRDGTTLPTVGNLGQFFGENDFDMEASQTGFYVSPGDAGELQRSIAYLLANPERAEEMGRCGRRMVEKLMRVDQFAERIRQVMERETGLKLSPVQQVNPGEGR